MFDIAIRKVDTLPIISRKFYLNGQPVDLTGYTIEFMLLHLDGTQIFSNPATLVNGGQNNEVIYQWSANDSAATSPGAAFALFKASDGNNVITFPNNKPISVIITDDATFEYSYGGDPTNRPLDKLRFLIQDTNLDRALFNDSELIFLLNEFGGNEYEAAVEAAETVSARFAAYARKTVGPLSIDYRSVATAMQDLALKLRSRASRMSGAQAISTGASPSKTAYFTLGGMDNTQGETTYLGDGAYN
jgi:hypothetical protein